MKLVADPGKVFISLRKPGKFQREWVMVDGSLCLNPQLAFAVPIEEATRIERIVQLRSMFYIAERFSVVYPPLGETSGGES